MMDSLRYISFILLLFCFGSCEQPPVSIKLSSKDYKIVDSIVKLEKVVVKKEIDSMCNYYNTVYYKHMVDSITAVKRAYIKEVVE